MTNDILGDIYKELGATPVINATGSLTILGGSILPPEVKRAMERADGKYIHLMDLQEKVGEAIANMLDVPAAYVTSGAGSALTLATAACMAGDDDAKIQQLPDTTGMRGAILIQKRHRYWYDRCLEFAGAKLVEFGSEAKTTADDLKKAINSNTAAVFHYTVEKEPDPDALSLEETIRIAHEQKVPVIVDAAGEVYPLSNLGKYVRMGADFQCIAAKYIGAPHSTGLALGSEEMIGKIALQSFAGYEGRRVRGIGRPQKIDRQEIVGVVAAIQRWISLNHEERLSTLEQKSQSVVTALQGIRGLRATLIENILGHHAFGVHLEMDPEEAGMTLHDVVAKLKDNDPPIWARVKDGENFISLHMFGLLEGEDKILGERIADLFS
jgi:uncharacterized pyridoxal phosphate-dependent enzyme